MRKEIYAMSVSLDGYIKGTDGDLSWTFPNEEQHKYFNDQETMIDSHFYGRGLYDIMASYWGTADENQIAPKVEKEYARILKDMKKIVISKTLNEVRWNSQLIRDNIAEEVNKLKLQPGRDMSVGGAGLASTFMKLGLVDEYCLYIHPIILGSGKPMFQNLNGKIQLKLIETHTFGSGVILLK